MDRYEEHDGNTFWGASTQPTNPSAMDFFGAPATIPGFTAAASSPGSRGVPLQRGSARVEVLDLNSLPSDLHLGMPYGERFRSASAGAVGEVDVAGGPRGAVPSRAASAARAATPIRAGSGGAPAGTAARLHRALRPARVAGGPPVGGRGGAGGSAGVAAGGPYDDDGALTQESQVISLSSPTPLQRKNKTMTSFRTDYFTNVCLLFYLP
ncbi:elastin-like isoform X3 [Panicum hallii]|uniref:elastin-like isoform X3 n=1 Tax=Panicum hallii TaxID=206008 RepID=UPI000DF4DC6D|nr:elastin-like isoform X3 [Panicum hallii]